MSRGMKLLFGAGGIYLSFLSYGKLHEQIFKYKSISGEKFQYAFFLQLVEAFANVLFSFLALTYFGKQKGLPLKPFAKCGISQILAKSCTSLALANGLSFPVVTLAKSGKMVPVMIGSIILGGKSYPLRQYLAVGAIILGTVIVTMDQKKSGNNGQSDSIWGILFILASLMFDGIVGGMQTDIQKEVMNTLGVKIAPFDMMFWTNLFMGITAVIICCIPFSIGSNGNINWITPELSNGFIYCNENPEIYTKIILFSVCSASGQSFIFYVISNFDSLTTTTITTTRKVMSTLLSIFTEGHSMNSFGWVGLGLASSGISMEIIEKMEHEKKNAAPSSPRKKV